MHGTQGLVRWDFRRPGELQVSSGDQYAGQPTSTVFSEPGDGEYAAFQPGAGIAMGYDDTKVVEARNFVQGDLRRGRRARDPGRRGRLRERPRRHGRLARDRGVGELPSTQGDAGFAVDTGPELPTRRIGVIGCGRIGRMHASLLAREVPGYVVAAVADAVPAAAEGVSAAIGAPVRSIEELLASDDVDTVAICSSTDTHVDLVIAAARGRQGDLLREAGQPRPRARSTARSRRSRRPGSRS